MSGRQPLTHLEAWVDLRPRAFSRTGGIVTDRTTGKRRRLNPAEYRAWLDNAAEHLAAHGRWRQLVGAVALDFEFSLDGFAVRAAVLEGQELRRRESGLTGDLDNYAKAATDALQLAGVLANDQQVVDLGARFRPRTKGTP